MKTFVACSDGFDAVTLAYKIPVEQSLIHPNYWCEARGAYLAKHPA